MGVLAVQNKTPTVDPAALSQLILHGDLSRLTAEQKVVYYNKVCEVVGLNPLTKPFDYLKLNGKEVLYANKGCGEQLRMLHKISIRITARETIEGVYVVTAEAANADGRVDSDTGAVPTHGLKGNDLANAMLKATTKAKRRVTLSICGLNMLDETEVETLRGVRPQQPQEGDGIPVTEYCCPSNLKGKFSRLAKKPISKADPAFLREAVVALEAHATATNKPIPNWAQVFIRNAEPYIVRYENALPVEGSFDAFEDHEPGSGG